MTRAWGWLREHPRWAWGLGGVLLAAASFGAGRFMAPTRVETRVETKTETKVEYRDRIVKVTESGPVKKSGRVVVEVLPGGGRRTTTDFQLEKGPTVELLNVERAATKTETKIEYREKIVERDPASLLLGAGYGARWDGVATGQASLVGGVRVLGPVWFLVVGQADVPVSKLAGSVTGNVAITF